MLYLFILVKKQIPTKNIHKISRIIFTITVEIITCMVNNQELYTSILIGSYLWSIGGQTHGWFHH